MSPSFSHYIAMVAVWALRHAHKCTASSLPLTLLELLMMIVSCNNSLYVSDEILMKMM